MESPATYPQLDEVTAADIRDVLVRVLRVIFPHENFPDGPYERSADGIVAAAQGSTWLRTTLTQGLLALTALTDGDFRKLSDDDATRVLRAIETTPFFNFIRSTAVVSLYDDAEVWQILGYEGASFDKGGYIDRGFDDLDWLPDPRIDYLDGPPMPENASRPTTRTGATTTPQEATK